MKINGKELSSHDNGNIIYYDNVLIKSISAPTLNEHTSFEFWIEYLKINHNFCGCKYHKMMHGHCDQSKALLPMTRHEQLTTMYNREEQLKGRYSRVMQLQQYHRLAGNTSKVWQAMSIACGLMIMQLNCSGY